MVSGWDPRDLVTSFHLGGIEYRVRLEPNQLGNAIRRLTSCHDHVFVVDQSHGVVLGVSETGRNCLMEEFGATAPD